MDISFVFNNGPKERTMELLQLFGIPFTKVREVAPEKKGS
jgi:hypothetical protein